MFDPGVRPEIRIRQVARNAAFAVGDVTASAVASPGAWEPIESTDMRQPWFTVSLPIMAVTYAHTIEPVVMVTAGPDVKKLKLVLVVEFAASASPDCGVRCATWFGPVATMMPPPPVAFAAAVSSMFALPAFCCAAVSTFPDTNVIGVVQANSATPESESRHVGGDGGRTELEVVPGQLEHLAVRSSVRSRRVE